MICEKFPTSTVIIVTMDVETIIDCDRVMVMEAGRIVELHEPHALLQVKKRPGTRQPLSRMGGQGQ